jgi:hypothetical protein
MANRKIPESARVFSVFRGNNLWNVRESGTASPKRETRALEEDAAISLLH